MGVVFPNFGNDDPMVASDVIDAADLGFDWLNGGIDPSGDIDNNSIQTRHIYAPESFGFPTNGQQAVFNDVYTAGKTDSAIIAIINRDRVDIFAEQLDPDELLPIAGMCKTLFVGMGDWVEVLAEWEGWEIHDTASQLWPARAGSFVVAWKDRATGVVTKLEHSRRELHVAPWDASTASHRGLFGFNTQALVEPVTAGVIDIFVAYERDVHHTGADGQTLIGLRTMNLERHK